MARPTEQDMIAIEKMGCHTRRSQEQEACPLHRELQGQTGGRGKRKRGQEPLLVVACFCLWFWFLIFLLAGRFCEKEQERRHKQV